MKFSQHIVVTVPNLDALLALIEEGRSKASSGMTHLRLLRFREKDNRYVIQVDFDSWESAEQNNQREETQAWAARLAELIDGEPKYENLDVLDEFGPVGGSPDV